MTDIGDASTHTIYQRIWEKGSRSILNGETDVDPMIDNPDDRRRGVTLILRPDASTLAQFQSVVRELKAIEPDQYFYAHNEVHITVLSVVSCNVDYDASAAELQHYRDVTRSCLTDTQRFDLSFRGLTLSAGGVLAQGYDNSGALGALREQLRSAFQESASTSVDQRYVIKTAHSTLMRFRKPIDKPEALVDYVKHRRSTDFGTTRVTAAELVENDWYHADGQVQLLEGFSIS
ncbi:MAG: 2'-5' RNA ligase family protein [Pseudomonadota bacterium]